MSTRPSQLGVVDHSGMHPDAMRRSSEDATSSLYEVSQFRQCHTHCRHVIESIVRVRLQISVERDTDIEPFCRDRAGTEYTAVLNDLRVCYSARRREMLRKSYCSNLGRAPSLMTELVMVPMITGPTACRAGSAGASCLDKLMR